MSDRATTMTDSRKAKVSKNQFAEVLYYWLSLRLNKKAVKKRAKEIHFKIRNNRDFNKIFAELLAFDMWLIIYTCERVFEDDNKRNDCLDTFHLLVYDRHIKKNDISFIDWMTSNTSRYIEYSTAMETEHPSTPLWVVANKLNKRLYGEAKKDLGSQLKVMAYIGLSVRYLGETIEKYDIEIIHSEETKNGVVANCQTTRTDKEQAKWFVLALLVVVFISIIAVQIGPNSSEAISRIDTMDLGFIEVAPRIEAIIISGSDESCIIVGGKLSHEGDIINGFRIRKIYPDRVEFEKNSKIVVGTIKTQPNY